MGWQSIPGGTSPAKRDTTIRKKKETQTSHRSPLAQETYPGKLIPITSGFEKQQG